MGNYKRFTVQNPDGKTYRAPIRQRQSAAIQNASDILSIFGDAIDRLGAYEDTGMSPEEVSAVTRRG